MFFSNRQKKISASIFLMVLVAFLFGSFNSIVTLWKSVYIEEGQSISAYNSVELDVLSALESSFKSALPPSQSKVQKVYLYISEKNQNHLLSSLPYSPKDWVKGLILDDNKFKKISVKHRGDNPNNWLHEKKSWRVKRKKSDLKDGMRVFNYSLPRDTALVNTYIGYFIAHKMNIPAPAFKFVELYINDRYEGLYLETQHIDENFLRMNEIMPVNIYKGTPSRTEKPINQDNDLFNNPFLWEKRSIFNARDSADYFDLEKFLLLIRASVNDTKKMQQLERIADIRKWANFSAYETIMQSWHNYEKNNMYLVSDPWIGQVYPIAYDTIFNDTKSRLEINEPVNMDNAAHALIEVYSNNSKFLYEKYKILNDLIDQDFYKTIKNEVNRIYDLIKVPWQDDPSHVQFTLTNEFKKNLIFNKGMDQEVGKLLERIDFIEENIKNELNSIKQASWFQSGNQLEFVINSHKPITEIKLCFDSKSANKILNLIEDNENRFYGRRDKNSCQDFNIIMNSNRVKDQNDRSRITTFSAANGFKIKPTVYKFSIDGDINIRKIYAKVLGNDNYIDAEKNSSTEKYTRANHNKPIDGVPQSKVLTWQGDIYISNLMVVNSPLRILPGTKIYLGPKASIIFKQEVQSIGNEVNKIHFLQSDPNPWGVVALVGKGTKGSIFEHTSFSGGSGGNIGGYEFTGMFSIYSSEDVKLSRIDISNNAIYDDLIHILYSTGIELSNSNIFDARSDAIDIDISEMIINNCNFDNSGNDAIDSMTSKVNISNTFINKTGDKGLSAGENSEVTVKNLIFDNTNIAIQSKDGTTVFVGDSKFLNNKVQLDAYQKNWRYGDGGKIEVKDSLFKGVNNKINAKNKSKIIVSNSYFNKSYLHLESKKVLLKDNYILN